MTSNAILLVTFALLAASPAVAQPKSLTVRANESWLFSLSRGQPVRARKAKPTAQPAEGQILVTVRTMMGTTMTIVSNNSKPYTYTAELIGAAKAVAARSCILPADARLSFENWPQKAEAVRLSNFKVAKGDGSCP